MFGSTGAVLVLNLASYGLLAWSATRGDLALGALAVYTQALAGANAYAAFNDGNAHLSFAAVVVPRLLALEKRLTAAQAGVAQPVVTPSADTRPLAAQAAVTRPAAGARPNGRDLPSREVTFDGVTFTYPRSERPALAGLSLTLPAHHSLAIVGENGAGKTSLVKLLCGLYQPTEGRSWSTAPTCATST